MKCLHRASVGLLGGLAVPNTWPAAAKLLSDMSPNHRVLCVHGTAHDLSVDTGRAQPTSNVLDLLKPSVRPICRQPRTEVPGRTKTIKRNLPA